jgi:hypothetical protein
MKHSGKGHLRRTIYETSTKPLRATAARDHCEHESIHRIGRGAIGGQIMMLGQVSGKGQISSGGNYDKQCDIQVPKSIIVNNQLMDNKSHERQQQHSPNTAPITLKDGAAKTTFLIYFFG